MIPSHCIAVRRRIGGGWMEVPVDATLYASLKPVYPTSPITYQPPPNCLHS